MTRKIAFLLSFFVVVVLSRSPLLAQHLAYVVDLRQTQATGLIPVVVHLTDCHDSSAVFQMPIWSQGNYGFWQGKSYVKDFKVLDMNQHELSSDETGLFQWTMADPTKLASLSYVINTKVLASSPELNVAAHVDSNGVIANGNVLFGWLSGHKTAETTVNVLFPDTWELATNLDATVDQKKVDPANKYHQSIFTANNFTELADAVLLASPKLNVSEFNVAGGHYSVAVASDDEALLDSIVQSTKALARATQHLFSRTPFTTYSAFYHVTPSANTTSVLSHPNASAYLVADGPWADVRRNLLPNVSMSLFSAWDGYEIKSYLLAPPDYRDTVHSASLWFINGTQRYYSAMLLARAGLMAADDFNVMLSHWVSKMHANAPDDTTSLEQFATNISQLNSRQRNYFESRAALTALALDLEIRSQTDDQSSLDQVMTVLDTKAYRGKTIIDKALTDSLSLAAGVDLRVFRARYVSGQDPLPLDSYVELMGLLMSPGNHATPVNFSAREGVSMTQRLRKIAMLAPRTSASFR
jgi:predicted metalloprotease with PDZ domain